MAKSPGIPFNSLLCVLCKNQISMKLNERGQYVCTAFPEGIPWKIVDGEFDHRKLHPEDNGIGFEIRDDLVLSDWAAEINEIYAHKEPNVSRNKD